MTWFEGVVDEYDAGRPDHPAAVYDALEPLRGRRVLDVGTGTGIAARELLRRGAVVTALDLGPEVLARAVDRSPGLAAVVADGAALPVRDATADLLCFAQSWHWLDSERRVAEARRALAPGGRWAGWWSHARADGDAWFDRAWDLIEARCPAVRRDQRDTDWGADLAASGFDVEQTVLPWTRALTVDAWLTDQASHSYVAALPADRRQELLYDLRVVIEQHVGGPTLHVPYETWLWVAARC